MKGSWQNESILVIFKRRFRVILSCSFSSQDMASDTAIKMNISTFFHAFFAGGIAAATSETIVAPLERVKILLQVQRAARQIEGHEHYKGIIDAFIRIPKEQGFFSFWRGNFTHIIRCFPTYALNFAFKETYRNVLLKTSLDKPFLQKFVSNLIAGGLAGATTLCFVYPLDFVETRLAADVGHTYAHRQFTGIVSCISTIVRSDGPFGLYRGFSSSVQGVFIYRSCYFGFFDTAKILFPNPEHIPILGAWCLAQGVATLSGFISYPFDSVRRRMMMQSGLLAEHHLYAGTLDCWKKIYSEEGVPGFYRGAGANIMRSAGGALVLVLYDQIKPILAKREKDAQEAKAAKERKDAEEARIVAAGDAGS